jgi:hypothetical protein
MYQEELFERLASKGWVFHANGAFSRVYTNDAMPEWVMKRGENDGTRTYLEWCMFKRRKGEFMKGMPEVDWLVSVGDGSYLCMMRRYYCARSLSLGWGGYSQLDYMARLIKVIKEELPFMRVNDLHSGNFMAMDHPPRKNRIVLTDPSSDAYRPLGLQQPTDELELVVQGPVA